MLSTSTHDTKRGEDARARLALLSEAADEWIQHVTAWSRILRARDSGSGDSAPPERNDEYAFYQLLFGAWPPEFSIGEPPDPAETDAFRMRLEGAMVKAMREAKVHTTWAAPNAAYEDAVLAFVRRALDASRTNPFFDSFASFEARFAPLGMRNSLVQAVLKLTVPGVPDIYQGAEIWDFSLVDPDNRRPVNFVLRRKLLDRLAELDNLAELMGKWQDGRIKLLIVSRLLQLRRQYPDLFASGSYASLSATGPASDRICAFGRTKNQVTIVVAASLYPIRTSLEEWGDSAIPVPEGDGDRWVNLLDDKKLKACAGVIGAAELFQTLPVAALVPERIFVARAEG
jgi:(1->4)-alpha-D-glucan 1-alpha-D-glucosylmutase